MVMPRGPKPIGDRAMTPAERTRRHRARIKARLLPRGSRERFRVELWRWVNHQARSYSKLDIGLVVQALEQLALAIQTDAYFYSNGDKHRCSWQARYLRSEDFWFEEDPKKPMGVNLDALTAIANLTPDEIKECWEREEAEEPATFDCTHVVP
jgi:hypothetical protein